ncbi:hypothetical protein B0G76_5168 [Paraburkholderia sp. BL23I1N1]|nr:hypothetical protein B0G76_5168 [Paraburkholderia sp. BL23I1N1]
MRSVTAEPIISPNSSGNNWRTSKGLLLSLEKSPGHARPEEYRNVCNCAMHCDMNDACRDQKRVRKPTVPTTWLPVEDAPPAVLMKAV